MPRIKRERQISLTQTDKKGLAGKDKLVTNIQNALSSYEHVYVVKVENMRNKHQKQLRLDLADSSVFFFGRNRIMARAFGSGPESEPMLGSHRISPGISGQVGVVFSNLPRDQLAKALDAARAQDFARAGTVATEAFSLPAGPVKSVLGVDMPHTMDPHLRKLGLPCRLVHGVVTLESPHVICKEGATLSTDQAHLLRLFGVGMAEFSVRLVAGWVKRGQAWTELSEDMQ